VDRGIVHSPAGLADCGCRRDKENWMVGRRSAASDLVGDVLVHHLDFDRLVVCDRSRLSLIEMER